MSALALRNPNRNIAMRVIVPALTILLILAILSTPAMANKLWEWILKLAAKIANALGLASSLRAELDRLNSDIPSLQKKVTPAEEKTLKWSSAYTQATKRVTKLLTSLADDRDTIKTLTSEISTLGTEITTLQTRLDWINAWFAHNDESLFPSVAGKLRNEKSDILPQLSTKRSSKSSKETQKQNLLNRISNTQADLSDARRAEKYTKARWDSAAAAEKALKAKIKTKQARAKALPGLITAQEQAAAEAQAEKRKAEERLRNQENN